MNLRELQEAHNILTDKDTTHSYLDSYEKLLEPYRNRHVDILEIGNCGGESLRLWDAYFDSCTILGLELLDFAVLDNLINVSKQPNITVYDKTDAYQEDTFDRFRGHRFDIIIDDGSHLPAHQLFVLNNWYQLLKDDGLLVIEDVQRRDLAAPIIDAAQFVSVRLNAYVIDLTEVKGRFDDILIVMKNKG